MKLFECQHCGQQLYFENTHCEQCGYALGYLCEDNTLLTLQQDQEDHSDDWTALTQPQQHYRYCANATYDACNWLLDSASEDTLCRACQLNRTIPDLSNPDHLAQWRSLEIAKHRLVYTLLRLRLPLRNKTEAPERGLAFDFLAELATPFRETAQVITGHAQGVITINIAEAD
ncbi:MAG: zinc-ribbon domain-containing protein, partial [Candidatus Competibacteraceae bacterium]|nr:zinc-ribbon domain-containing protein [Candidatus Competibacteraceae bacterium]